MNVREIGSYEIAFCDKNNKRIKEIVTDKPLYEVDETAMKIANRIGATSFYISRVVRNSLFNNWARLEKPN